MSYGLITDVDHYREYLLQQVPANAVLTETFKILLKQLFLRDEFLTY